MLSRLENPTGIVLAGARNRPVAQFYADNAYRFLEEGLVQRDLLALEGLILAHAPSPVNRVVPLRIQRPDPFRFVVLTGLYEALGIAALPRDIGELRDAVIADLSPEVRDQAHALIDRELIRWSARQDSFAIPKTVSPAAINELCVE